MVARLPAQTIKHGNRPCYTAGCLRREKKSRPVQLLNSSSLPLKFLPQQIGTSHFSAVSSNSRQPTLRRTAVLLLPTIGHKFCASFFPPPLQGHIRKLSPKLKAPGRTIDLQQCSAFFLSLFCSSCHRAQFVQRSNPLRKQPVVQVSFHCSQQPLLIALLHDVSWKFRVGHTPPLLFFVFFFHMPVFTQLCLGSS